MIKIASLIALAAAFACSGEQRASYTVPGGASDGGAVGADHDAGVEIVDEFASFSVATPMFVETQAVPMVRVAYASIQVRVHGDLARTTVTELIKNDLESEAELVFEFPLPRDATVTGFAHWVDGKRIDASVGSKEQARRAYETAAREGKKASLAEQDDIRNFKIKLASLPPGGQRRVELSYTQTLETIAGQKTYLLPAKRYNPGPTVLDVAVDVAAEAPITSATAVNHLDASVRVVQTQKMTARLSRSRLGLGSDFVLRWTETADDIDLSATAVRTHDGELGYVLTRFSFNRDPNTEDRQSLDVVMVIDRSLSMSGEPLASAQDLASQVVDGLHDDDRVALVSYASDVRELALAAATDQHKTATLDGVASLRTGGHSNMVAAIDVAADMLRDSKNGLLILMSDGQPTIGEGVDGDSPVAVKSDFATTRVIVAHFNYPTQKAFLESIFPTASVHYIPDGRAAAKAISQVANLAVAPVIENFKVELEGAAEGMTHGQVPSRLALGEQVRLVARGAGTLTVRVTGELHGRPISATQRVSIPETAGDGAGVDIEWARVRVAALEATYREHRDSKVADKIRRLGTRYKIATFLTSFVARDTLYPERIKPGDPEIRVSAPQSSESVWAVLPWGEVVSLTWQNDEGLWLGRFLVPRSAADGMYRVRVFVRTQGRTGLRSTLFVRVDSVAPKFTFSAHYARGKLSLRATPKHAVFDRSANGDTLMLDRVDVKRIVVQVGDTEIPLQHTEDKLWTADRSLSLGPGDHELTLTAHDFAANSSQEIVVLTVAGSAQ